MFGKYYHPISCANQYIRQLRKVESLYKLYKEARGIKRLLLKVTYTYNSKLLFKLGKNYNLDIGLFSCGEGLTIYHIAGGVVINEHARIGKNLTLHGCNCIGNDGKDILKAPILGNNVHLGYGASVIGDIVLGDNIWIAAGSVVVHSFEENGLVIGGIPAKIIKKL